MAEFEPGSYGGKAIAGMKNTDASFTTGLPDGDYELIFWQEKYKEQTQKITVKSGKAEANAVYNADKKN